MNKKFFTILFFICIFVFIFSGCNSDKQPVEATGPQNPTSEIEGFYDQHQVVEGGTDGSGYNLVDVKITSEQPDVTTLTFTFGQGNTNQDNSYTPSKNIPKYDISFVEGINRMVISFHGVSYYSYKLYEDEISNPLIDGVFAQRPVNTQDSFLYLNINTDYAYKAHEDTNQIIVTVHKVIGSDIKKSYYVTLNAFDEYEVGYLGEDFPLKPTMCSDGKNIVLISQPFAAYDEANQFIVDNKYRLEGLLAGKKFVLSEIDNSNLPDFSEEAGFDEIANTPIGYKDGETLSFPSVITNGRFLCFNDSVTKFVYAQPNTIYGNQEGDSLSFEYLYVQDVETAQSIRLLENQFSSVTDAQFSHDSKYLAFIEQNDVLRQLQILSLEDGKLYIPSEDSFGIDTASFAWADDKNVLYAINGEFQSKQLLSYDLSDPNNVQVRGILEKEFTDSVLQLKGDRIYYVNRNIGGSESEICMVDLNIGECSVITNGNSFLLSPDGGEIIVNDVINENGSETYRLRCYDLEQNTETIIYSGELINNITWSKEGSRVYYSVYSDNAQNDQYPYELSYYDLSTNQSHYMMNTIASALYSGQSDEEVLLMCIFTYKNKPVPVTFQVK